MCRTHFDIDIQHITIFHYSIKPKIQLYNLTIQNCRLIHLQFKGSYKHFVNHLELSLVIILLNDIVSTFNYIYLQASIRIKSVYLRMLWNWLHQCCTPFIRSERILKEQIEQTTDELNLFLNISFGILSKPTALFSFARLIDNSTSYIQICSFIIK